MEQPTAVQWFPEFLDQADKKSSGSPNDVDTFKVNSQLIYFNTEN
jgi:hypothetical protein